MRRAFVPLIAVWIAALAPAPASASVRTLRYQLTFSGRLTVSHSDHGLQANGAPCGLGTPDDTSPFSDRYTLSLRWTTGFALTLRGKRLTANARTTRISGGQFSYAGFAYDFNCHEIVYGPGGQPCTGTLASGGGGGGGGVVARASPAREPKRLVVALSPFGSLLATPAACTVDVVPQVTYAAADELGLASIGQTIARTFRLPVAKRVRTYAYKLNLSSDCTQPPQSAGETDTCSTTYTGAGSLKVRPR